MTLQSLAAPFVRRILPRSEFARDVTTLSVGTAIAQGFPVLAAPLLTRLYTPAEFGAFALFMAISSVLGVFAAGRYELAILLPADDGDAAAVLRLSLLLTTLSGGLAAIVFAAGGPAIAVWLGTPDLSRWLLLIPLGVATTTGYQALGFWFNRKRQYKRLAINRITRSALTVVATVIFGAFDRVSQGLIIGTLIGQGLTTLGLWFQAEYGDRALLREVRLDAVRRMALRYRNFPLFSVPADGINAITAQLPIFFLNAFYSPAIAGLFGLTQRVLGAPVGVVAAAFADVFKQRAARDFNKYGSCRAVWRTTFRQLVLIGAPPFILLALAGPSLFAWFFGEQWRSAGRYAQVFVPWFLLGFIVSPLSRTLYVAERQKYDLLWQIGLIGATGAGLLIGHALGGPLTSLAFFAGAYSGMYLIYLYMSYHFSEPRRIDLLVAK